MGVLDTLRSLAWPNPTFTPAIPSIKDVTFNTDEYPGTVTGALGPWGQTADWSGVLGSGNLERSYRMCATAYACSTFLADAVAEAPLRVYTYDENGDLQEVADHRARYVLSNPNPFMSEAEFMSLIVMQMGLFGYTAIEKVRNGSGIPVQLWPVRPDWLRREVLNDGTARWVLRRPRVAARIIPDENVILIPYRNDERQEAIGITPLQIVAREVGIDVALTDLLKVFLDAGGIPPWAVEVPEENPDQTQVDVFRERWNQTYSGTKAYSRIGILHGGMKLVKVGDSIGDMAWPELRGLTEMKIAQAYRVPADLIQARDSMKSGSLTTTEMDGAMAALQHYGAAPLRARIDGAFTRAFLPDFVGTDSRFTVEFDTSMILSLQEDKDALHTRVRADFDAGIITMAEARQETGRPDLGPATQIFKTAFTTVYLPLAQLTEPATTIAETPPKSLPATTSKRDPVYRDYKAMSPVEVETKANLLTTMARDRKALTQILDRKMRQFWKAQGTRIVQGLPGKSEQKDVLVDWGDELRRLSDLMMQYYGVAGDKAYTSAAAVTGASLTFDLANPNVQHLVTDLGKRIVGIHETTRLDVSKTVTTGLAEGLSPPSIAEKLTTMFEQTYKNRSQTVARTETMYAYNTASAMGYAEAGNVAMVEMVDNPEHEDDYGASDGLTCAQRDGMVVPLDDVPKHVEAEHPNGSLAIIPILTRPLGED